MIPKSRPVLIVFSILAALQVLSGASALADIIGKDTFALFALVVAAVQVGMTFYVQNQVVPVLDVGAYTNNAGHLVAGPAAGVTNGKEVEVVKTEAPASEGGNAATGPGDTHYYGGAVNRDRGELGAISSPAAALIIVGALLALLGALVADVGWLLWVGIVVAIVGVVLLLVGHGNRGAGV